MIFQVAGKQISVNESYFKVNLQAIIKEIPPDNTSHSKKNDPDREMLLKIAVTKS